MPCCCDETKKTVRKDDEKRKLITRLSKIEGQVRALKRMIDEDTYCMDILVQSMAASSSFTSFQRELLSSHIQGCVTDGIRNGNEEVVEELISLLDKVIK